MISKTIIDFLTLLKENNNREWFAENRKLYDIAKTEFENTVKKLIPRIAEFDKSIGLQEPKDCIFRIYRDTRFSHDKTPYKSNFGAYFSRGGKNGGYAGYYFNLEPASIFLSGGLYLPMPNILKSVRTEIFENPQEFKKIISTPDFKKLFGEVWYGDSEKEKLKTAPKGFPKDFELIEILKYKNFVTWHNVSDKIVLSSDFEDYAINIFKSTFQFNSFLNRAVEHA